MDEGEEKIKKTNQNGRLYQTKYGQFAEVNNLMTGLFTATTISECV